MVKSSDIQTNLSFTDAFNSGVRLDISNDSIKSKIKKSARFLIFLAILITIIIITCVILILIGAFLPCALQRCAENSICVNHLFNAECRCKKGFNGNGKSFCDECGVTFQSENSENNRIVGGKEASKHSWPSTVLIQIYYKTIANLNGEFVIADFSSFCGGTIIDAETIMTAAHCAIKTFSYYYNDNIYEINITSNNYFPKVESIFTVFVGGHSAIQSNSNIAPAKAVSVSSVIVHESYDDKNILNDIALLKLSKRLELDDKVQIACLPDFNERFYPSQIGISSVVVGWGVLEESGAEPDSLQNVRITIYDPELCVNSTDGVETNWESQICAGDYSGGKDSCQGDSGGSLYIEDFINGKKKFVSVGIVSYGQGCAREHLPGIYTRVSYFHEWIYKKLYSNQ